MKKLVLAITVALCTASFGQNSDVPKVQREINQTVAEAVAPACAYNFSSGVGNTFVKFCVLETGNVVQIETPEGHQQFTSGNSSEGYGLCDASPAGAAYFDYGVDGNTANWGSPTLLSQSATSVKIARTTDDGIWTLTQTISLVPATPGIQVVMALKNNTAVPRTAYLVRYSDVDANGTIFNDLSGTANSAYAWVATVPFAGNFGTGLQLKNVGNSQFGFVSGYARTTFHGPNPCNFAGEASATPVVNIDGSIALAYVDTIAPKKTKTTTLIYRGL